MRGFEHHMYEPGIQAEAGQLRERARYERAMWTGAQQEQILGLGGGGGYPAGGIVLGAPMLPPGGTVRYHYVFGAPRGGALGFGAYPPGIGYAEQVVPGQHPPYMDARWLMYQAALGGDMAGQYYTWY